VRFQVSVFSRRFQAVGQEHAVAIGAPSDPAP
jgi:hypothetical protein